jgi:3-dehydroquinate synthase
MTQTIRVALGARSYDVLIGPGLIGEAGGRLKDIAAGRKIAVAADETVAERHGDTLMRALGEGGLSAALITLPPGEESKSFEGLSKLCDALLALKLDRNDLIIAFGGGVVGDLAGFAAAVLKRGVDFVQIPTTLLAQVDSSVGGKTAIDTLRGKNLIGAFHQPLRVLADLNVLRTLPPREIRCGYAEIIKYGLLGDPAFFEWLERHGARVLALDPEPLGRAVRRSIEMKAEIVAEDERETGRRALLNLGHTFGHALEAEAGFGDQLLHGEAVGAGMAMAFRFSEHLQLCAPGTAARVEAALAGAGLPTRLRGIWPEPPPAERLIDHMAQDKKAQGGRLSFILARAIGDSFVAKDVETAILRDFLILDGAA